jgi:hypothetical protein
VEATPEALAAFAHPRESPVAGSLTASEDLRIYTYPIVAHADSEVRASKNHLCLDTTRFCMIVRVTHRFARDAISIVTNDDGQLARPAFDDYAVVRPRPGVNSSGELSSECAERGRDIAVVNGRSMQAPDGVTSLADRQVPDLHGRVQELRRVSRTLGKQLPYSLQSKHQTLDALQERVVKVARDPGALGESYLEQATRVRARPRQPQAIQHNYNGNYEKHKESIEPTSLKPSGIRNVAHHQNVWSGRGR